MHKKLRNILVLAVLNAIFMGVGTIFLSALVIFLLASIPQMQTNLESYQTVYIVVTAVLGAIGGSFYVAAWTLNLICSIMIITTDFENPQINDDGVRLLWGLLSLFVLSFIGQFIFVGKAKSINKVNSPV